MLEKDELANEKKKVVIKEYKIDETKESITERKVKKREKSTKLLRANTGRQTAQQTEGKH